jgi:hypothetical protein
MYYIILYNVYYIYIGRLNTAVLFRIVYVINIYARLLCLVGQVAQSV